MNRKQELTAGELLAFGAFLIVTPWIFGMIEAVVA